MFSPVTNVARNSIRFANYTWAAPGTLGNGTPAPATFTNLTATISFTSAGTVITEDGSLSTPIIRWSTDTDTGFYRPADNSIGLVCNGAAIALFNATGLLVTGDLQTSGLLKAGTTPKTLTNAAGFLLGGTVLAQYAAISATYTASLSDHILNVNANSGAVVINLPTAASAAGKTYIVKKIDASVNTVTIDGNGSETIDGATTKVLSVQYASYTIYSNGMEWFII